MPSADASSVAYELEHERRRYEGVVGLVEGGRRMWCVGVGVDAWGLPAGGREREFELEQLRLRRGARAALGAPAGLLRDL